MGGVPAVVDVASVSSYITSKLYLLFYFRTLLFAFEPYTYFCKCYKVCLFPSHTTFSLQQVHSLPSQTTLKFSLYFLNKLCWNHTDLGIGGSRVYLLESNCSMRWKEAHFIAYYNYSFQQVHILPDTTACKFSPYPVGQLF